MENDLKMLTLKQTIIETLKKYKEVLGLDYETLEQKVWASEYIPLDVKQGKQINQQQLDALLIGSRKNVYAWVACSLLAKHPSISNDIKYKIKSLIGKKPKKQGRSDKQNAIRNYLISQCVFYLQEQGVSWYSNGNDTKKTACLIVSEALESINIFLTPSAVKKISKKYKKNVNI
jgi:hypothetical protein